MKRTLIYHIKENPEHKTAEQYLREKGYSKAVMTHLKKSPTGLSVGGERIYTTYVLKPGDTLTVALEETDASPHIVPTPMNLDILYEDQDLMVINKAADLPIHPSQGNFDNTLANGVAFYFQEKGEAFTYRAINRLDRDTTGLLILAKHMLSGALLSSMVSKRQIKRTYLAAVLGKTPEQGTITAPISRVDGSTIERCVDFDHGEPACTHYKRLAYGEKSDCSLVQLRLETGRTHQIRVHMKHIGHPLPGDFLYCPDYHLIRRQSLHSFRLEFPHPITGEPMTFQAPLPEDMRLIWKDEDLWDNDFLRPLLQASPSQWDNRLLSSAPSPLCQDCNFDDPAKP